MQPLKTPFASEKSMCQIFVMKKWSSVSRHAFLLTASEGSTGNNKTPGMFKRLLAARGE